MLQIGSVIDGKYKILNKIGQGGMSVVYLAMNERANKQWAIKEVRKDGTQNYEVVKQGLIVETDLLKRLNHPNLPSIIDVIDEDETFLIVMDYIEGNPLDKALKEHGAQNQEDVVRWSIELCDVLGYLHSRQPAIIYRDMKPANVMLRPDGHVTLIDFGTAREYKSRSSQDTAYLGTKEYAAPEQFGGQGQTDARTDIYTLGATMYHLVTGQNPMAPPFYKMLPIRAINPALSSGLERIIIRCTQENPQDRYQSCAELMYDLEHFRELDNEYRKKQRRQWSIFLGTSILTLATLAGGIGFSMAENSTRQKSYDYSLTEARSTTDADQQLELYRQAINLNPSEGKGYIELMDYGFLGDNAFTQDESNEFTKILGLSDGGTERNEDILKDKDKAGYEALAFKAGMAYFYYYEQSGGKQLSQKWLNVVANAESLTEQQRERGRRLAKISEYYHSIGVQNATGDASITYERFWNDMTSLTKGNLVELDNEKTALVMYKELASLIHTNCTDFKNAGVTKEQMEEELVNMESHVETDIIQAGKQKGYEDLIDNLHKAIGNAREQIAANF